MNVLIHDKAKKAIFFILLGLCIFVASTLATKILPTSIKSSLIRPLITSDIRVRYSETSSTHGGAFTSASIDTLSSSTLSLQSQNAPLSPQDASFKPFGDEVRIQFRVQDDAVQGETDIDYSFILRVDESIVNTNPANPSVMIDTAADDNNEIVGYSKHIAYTGTRIDDQGREEVLIVAFLPISQYSFNDESIAYGNNGLESLSDKHVSLSTDSQSGRDPNGYTIIGSLQSGSGKTYRITSYNTLLFESTTNQSVLIDELNQLKLQQSEMGSQSDFFTSSILNIQSEISNLSDTISTLITQQANAAYDLAIVEEFVDTDVLHASICGVDSDHHGKDNNTSDVIDNDDTIETNNDILSMKSSWTLTQWANCHPRMNKKATILELNIWVSASFQLFASNTNDISKINDDMITAQVHLTLAWINRLMFQQLDVTYGIKSIKKHSTTKFTADNPQDGLNCKMDDMNIPFSTTVGTGDGVNNVNFVRCYSRIGTIAGVASLGTFCNQSPPSVAAMAYLNDGLTIFNIIVAHELGHNLGLNHSNSGIMAASADETNNKIRNVNDNDNGHFGFDQSQRGALCDRLTTWMNNANLIGKCIRYDSPITPETNFSCNYDGLVDPFEECDMGEDTPCCKNCRLTEGATCFGESECCIDCKLQYTSTKCSLPTDTNGSKSGVCQAGVCAAHKFTCGCDGWRQNTPCQFVCPECDGVLPQYSMLSNVPCDTDKICSSQFACVVDPAKSNFSWRKFIHRECSVGSNNIILPTIEKYLCYDGNGVAIHPSRCDTISKPSPSGDSNCSGYVEIKNIKVPSNVNNGQQIDIVWAYMGSDFYDVVLYMSNSDTPITTVPGAQNKYTYTLPSNLEAGVDYNIRIERGGNGGDAYYSTSNTFSIATIIANPTIPSRVTPGKSIKITWTALIDTNDTIDILYKKSILATTTRTLATNVAIKAQEHTFIIPSDIELSKNAVLVLQMTSGEKKSFLTNEFSTISIDWRYGEWDNTDCEADVVTETSQRKRSVECYDNENKTVLNDNQCDSTTKPIATQNCNAPDTDDTEEPSNTANHNLLFFNLLINVLIITFITL